MSGECAECRFWKNGEQDAASVGICPMLATVKGDGAEILVYGPWNGLGERVVTHQEFGCIQFETRI